MTKNIIKYGGLTLVIIGIVLVMKNLFTSDTDWQNDKSKNNKTAYYNVKVSLLDKDTQAFLEGANLVIKDESGQVISGFTTESGVHLVQNLKKGNYTLLEEQAPEGYHLNEEGVSFTIKNSDEVVTMFNTALTEEEKAELKQQNTTSDEVGVENTLSNKSIISLLGGIFTLAIGLTIIFSQKKS